MKNVKTAGEVRLPAADIGEELGCIGAEFSNPGGNALIADRLKVKGGVFLRGGFKATGAVRLLGADIGGDLDCDGAELNNPGGNALIATGLKVKGSVFLRNGFKATGEVRLPGADIGRNLECIVAEFRNPNGNAFTCDNASIKGTLFLRELEGLVGALNLTHAKVGSLNDDKTGWPENGKLDIDGFEYGGLPGDATPKTAASRLDWLRRQPEFNPRPYEQLAKVFREMGRESDMRAVLIAKQEDWRKHGSLSRKRRAWNRFLGITIGHGYQTWRAFAFLAIFLVVGWDVFIFAKGIGIMECSKECGTGNTFNPFMYSLDVLLPVINFHQKDYYSPNATTLAGEIVRWYFWIHIAVGWVFTTLAVASLTGLVRKGKE